MNFQEAVVHHRHKLDYLNSPSVHNSHWSAVGGGGGDFDPPSSPYNKANSSIDTKRMPSETASSKLNLQQQQQSRPQSDGSGSTTASSGEMVPLGAQPHKSYSPRVHAVIQEARRVFTRGSGMTPEHLDLTLLRERLSQIRPEDVNGDRLRALSRGEVGYVSLEDNTDFTIGVFFLAPGAHIPLHDHPEMCVLSQLVKGAMHVTSYDFDLASTNNLAFQVDNGLYTAPVTRILYPTSGGNLHSFSTKTGCIIVDVMSPPYDEMDGRECTYFKALPFSDHMYKVDRVSPPEDFEVLDLS